MLMKTKKKILLSLGICLCICLFFIGLWGYTRFKKAKAIQRAIANPKYIDPEELLNVIDDSFRKLSDAQKKELMSNPLAIEKRVADATYKELKKSYKLLFTLPSHIRKQVIQQSADDLRAKALQDPEKVADFFESPTGMGSLRGASKFFLMELTGKQKSESAPLTQAMYEIIKRQAYLRKASR